MARMVPDTVVELEDSPRTLFRFPPSSGGEFVIAVHPQALKAREVTQTTVAQLVEGHIAWVGSLDEQFIEPTGRKSPGIRAALSALLLTGPSFGRLLRPGPLRPASAEYDDTVYRGDRPWLVVGESPQCGRLAMPLNDRTWGKAKWYQADLDRHEVLMPGAKDGTVELAHLWSFPASTPIAGSISDTALERIAESVHRYYRP
jgi:hypothetical protein